MKYPKIEPIRFYISKYGTLQKEGCDNYFWGLKKAGKSNAEWTSKLSNTRWIAKADRNGEMRFVLTFNHRFINIEVKHGNAWVLYRSKNAYPRGYHYGDVYCRYPKLIEAFLQDWCDNPDIKLVMVMQHCNRATGYPVWSLHYIQERD